MTQTGDVDEARALWEIKTWLPWVPKAVFGLGCRDLRALVIIAYYEAAMIAAELYVPKLSKALFLHKRGEVIGCVWSELKSIRGESVAKDVSTAGIDDAIDMVVVPMVYATRYRVQHAGRFDVDGR